MPNSEFDRIIAYFMFGMMAIIGMVIVVSVVAQVFAPIRPASVLFDRDQEGRITGIHYVPMGVRT